MNTYIRSVGNVSPQRTFGNNSFPVVPMEYNVNRLSCIEPDYRKLIDVKSIRRMSRIIKMGVTAALACLEESGTKSPDAIITGTAYGCLQDTESFLAKMVENKEELLTPTAFIQSTHNTVGAQIALLLDCHQYNNTFVHRGFSFESAVLDAILLLQEIQIERVLVGGIDEITATSHAILSRMGLYKKDPISNLALYDTRTKGTIAGEGAAFFLLSSQPSGNDFAKLDGVSTLYNFDDPFELEKHILEFLDDHSVRISDIDLLITGRNGDIRQDMNYDQLTHSVFGSISSIPYKHLCGEYPTSTAFALWLAAVIVKSGYPPLNKEMDNPAVKPIKRLLIYNQYQHIHHSLFLVSSC